MARVSVAVLERNLEYARKREAYLRSTTARPVKATVDKRPKKLVAYRSSLLVSGGASNLYKVQASEAGLAFFGGTALTGLGVSTTLTGASPAPRNFKPAKINAVVGDPTPVVKTAAGSTRRYVKYSANSAGDAQSSYSSPISKAEALVTPTEQSTLAALLGTATKPKIGAQYGRIWFTPEKYVSSLL